MKPFGPSDFSSIAKRSSPGSASKCKDSEPMKQLCRQCHLTSGDTQDFLLPQRRTRAWAMGSLLESDPVDFIQRCEQCLVDMRSSTHVEGFWEDSLATQPFPIKSQTRLEALARRRPQPQTAAITVNFSSTEGGQGGMASRPRKKRV